MKHAFLTVAFFAIAMLALAQSKDETKVADAVQQLRKAMLDADSVALARLTAEKLSYGHSGGLIENKQEFMHKLVSGRSDFVTMELSDQTISVSDNVALVRHTLKGSTMDNGKAGDVHLKVLLVWQKQKGGWKLLARQAIKQQ
jgi:ketosteroid isomerase-like protein